MSPWLMLLGTIGFVLAPIVIIACIAVICNAAADWQRDNHAA